MDLHAVPQRAPVRERSHPESDAHVPRVPHAHALGGGRSKESRTVGLQPLPFCACSETIRPRMPRFRLSQPTTRQSPCTGSGAAPAPAPALFQYTTGAPPPLPLRESTNSALYVPLLLDAAGLLTAQAQLAWRSRAPISQWWPAAVEALRARPFIPVDELTQALEHIALAFAPPALQAPSVQRFRAWAGARAGQVASLSEVLRAIAVAPEGHYVAAPLQEALLTLLIGPPAVATLARLIETLRARPFDAPDPPPPIRPGDSADAAAPAAVRPRSDAQLPLPAALTGRADPVVTAVNATPAVRPSVHNLQGALPGPPAGSAPPDVENPAELDGHRDQALPDPDSSRVADADTSLARLAAQATSHSRAGGRGRRGGRGRGRSRGRRLADDDRPAPAPEADTAADGPALNREGTAAQRRVAAAEDGMRIGLAALDDVCLEDTFRCRTLTLQGVPARLRGALRTAMRTGLELISERTSPQQELRGWKLFLLAPRMLLHRAAGQARIPPAELALRCEAFARGEWVTLLHAAARTAEAPHLAAARSAAQDVEARAHRAAALVHLGELSAAGRALTAEPLAPATDATLAELRDPVRRPPEPYGPLPSEVASYQPGAMPVLVACLPRRLRKARRGAAAGPSGARAAAGDAVVKLPGSGELPVGASQEHGLQAVVPQGQPRLRLPHDAHAGLQHPRRQHLLQRHGGSGVHKVARRLRHLPGHRQLARRVRQLRAPRRREPVLGELARVPDVAGCAPVPQDAYGER